MAEKYPDSVPECMREGTEVAFTNGAEPPWLSRLKKVFKRPLEEGVADEDEKSEGE